jgi:chromosome segregation ATPase
VNIQLELEKADRIVKDTEIKLRTIKVALDGIDAEIQQLNTLEAELEENLQFLKKKNIIALAQEYKKAKEDLTKTKNRLAMLRIDAANVGRAFGDCEAYLKKAKEAYAKLLKGSDNVVRGNFGRRSDGQK